MSENMNGNHINVISNEKNPLDMSGEKLEYNFELDECKIAKLRKQERMMVIDVYGCNV